MRDIIISAQPFSLGGFKRLELFVFLVRLKLLQPQTWSWRAKGTGGASEGRPTGHSSQTQILHSGLPKQPGKDQELQP